MPGPLSGNACNLISPQDPKGAMNADDAHPGEMAQVKADQRDSQTGKYGAASSQPFQPAGPDPDDPNKKLHWIEISLVREDDGTPIAGEAYCITMPGGQSAEGTLNDKGCARVDGIPNSCECVITFPKLDKGAWKPK